MSPPIAIDALTSATLKQLREHWWNDDFTDFIREMLRPRPGNRILDVGCGTGDAEISIGRLQLSQIQLFGVDQLLDRVIVARFATASHNQRVGFAVGDACRLPFLDGAFDSTYSVAVLQYVTDLTCGIKEFARVTRAGGRVLVVEPDNTARYWYSSVPSGAPLYQARSRFFAALAAAEGDRPDGVVGPRVPELFAAEGIETLEVRVFPVSRTQIGPPGKDAWVERTRRIQQQIDRAPADTVRTAGREYLEALASYAAEADKAATPFVEIQNTLLFATVGQKTE